MNFQESTTILNACTKTSGNLLNAPHIFFLFKKPTNGHIKILKKQQSVTLRLALIGNIPYSGFTGLNNTHTYIYIYICHPKYTYKPTTADIHHQNQDPWKNIKINLCLTI